MRSLNKLDEKYLLFYDIETAPIIKELEIDTPLYDSWEYKVNKKGEMTSTEIIEFFSKEAGLYPEFSKIITISVGYIEDDIINIGNFTDLSEKQLLNNFNELLKKYSNHRLCGFFNIGFDSPFVMKRMIVNNIKPHSNIDLSGLKPWEVDQLDLSKEWQSTSINKASLINIATALGLPSPKDDISGKDVGRVYWENPFSNISRISKYCDKDVITSINIFRRMKLEPIINEVKRIEFDTSSSYLTKLFHGENYDKSEIIKALDCLDKSELNIAFDILESIVSRSKKRTTKITKKDINELRKLYSTS